MLTMTVVIIFNDRPRVDVILLRIPFFELGRLLSRSCARKDSFLLLVLHFSQPIIASSNSEALS